MALSLNVFKTYTADLTTSPTVIYTAPTFYTGIVLMAQVTNTTNTTANVTVTYDSTELLKQFDVPGHDAVSAVTGKLVIETGKTLSVSAGVNSALKIVVSVLETANE